MADFNKALSILIKAEGGWTLHTVTGDRGGTTYAGISARAHPNWPGWDHMAQTRSDEKRRKALARILYQTKYWNRIGGDYINSQAVAEAIFLHAVVSGVKTAVKAAQRATKVDGLAIDGIIGPNTLKAINGWDEEILLLRMAVAKCRRRATIAQNDKSQLKFLPGWIFRALKYV